MTVSKPAEYGKLRLCAKIGRAIGGYSLFLIGLVGVPGNIKKMLDTAECIGSETGRWILTFTGLLVIFWAHGVYPWLWKKIAVWQSPNAASEPPIKETAKQTKPRKSTARLELIKRLEGLAEHFPVQFVIVDYIDWRNEVEALIRAALGAPEAANFADAAKRDVVAGKSALAHLRGLIIRLKDQSPPNT